MNIRLFQPTDFDAVTILWRISREKSLPELEKTRGHFFYEDRAYFREHILPEDQVWIMEEDHSILAFMAMRADFIDQLYVHPDFWRKGLGRQFLRFASTLSPPHLWLYTLQANHMARRFYEKNGFRAERFGVSPPPENEPDVEYHWRAAAAEPSGQSDRHPMLS